MIKFFHFLKKQPVELIKLLTISRHSQEGIEKSELERRAQQLEKYLLLLSKKNAFLLQQEDQKNYLFTSEKPKPVTKLNSLIKR